MENKELKELLEKINDISEYLIDNLNELKEQNYIDLDDLVSLLSDIELDLKDTHELVDKAFDKASDIQEQDEIDNY